MNQMRAFVAVAQHGSIAAAARSLGWSQPTVSHHLRTLESETQTQVISRDARGVSLTRVGEILLPSATKMLGFGTEIDSLIREATASSEVNFRIGTIGTAADHLLPNAMRELAEEAIRITLIENKDPHALGQQLEEGTIDAAIGYTRDGLSSGVHVHRLLREELYVLVDEHHPLAEAEMVALEDLEDENWITSTDSTDPCDVALYELASSHGLAVRSSLQSDNYAIIRGYIQAGLGIALMPATSVLNRPPRIRALPLQGDVPVRDMFLLTTERTRNSSSFARLHTALKRSAKDLAARLPFV